MNDKERLELLAREIALGGFGKAQEERKRCELVMLLQKVGKYSLETSDRTESRDDNLCFAEALAAALQACAEQRLQGSFLAYFQACYYKKSTGVKAAKLAELHHDLYASRLAELKRLLDKISAAEGIDCQAYKNSLHYPNTEKVLSKLREWRLADKYRQAVEDIFNSSNIVYIQKGEQESEAMESMISEDCAASLNEREQERLLLADIIERSYALSRAKRLYAVNRCDWSGQLYTAYDRIIPLLFEIYLERGYLTYYEAQALWEILDNRLMAGYLHMAPDTIRKKRKQLEAINLLAWREVGGING